MNHAHKHYKQGDEGHTAMDTRRCPPWHLTKCFIPWQGALLWQLNQWLSLVMQVNISNEEAVAGRVAQHVKELEKEVEVLKNLQHPNIVRYLVGLAAISCGLPESSLLFDRLHGCGLPLSWKLPQMKTERPDTAWQICDMDVQGTHRSEDCLNIFLEYVPGGSIASLLTKFGKACHSHMTTVAPACCLAGPYQHGLHTQPS